MEEVLENFRFKFLIDASSDLDLVLYTGKCEIIGNDENKVSAMLSNLPSLSSVSPAEAFLLGSLNMSVLLLSILSFFQRFRLVGPWGKGSTWVQCANSYIDPVKLL